MPDQFLMLAVGDASQIRSTLEAANLGPMEVTEVT